MPAGPHVNRYHAAGARPSLAAHIEAARREAADGAGFELGAVAFFVSNPRSGAITLHEEERRELREYLAAAGLRAVAHSAYCAAPWQGDAAAARLIREEAAVCQAAGVGGLVVHLPKAPPAQVLRHAGQLLGGDAPDVRIYLETPAVAPAESHYETSEKLAGLFAALAAGPDPGLARFGLCVDTAHLWVSGVDLRTYAAADGWLGGLEAAAGAIPPDRVMFHLNDSLRPLGRGPDAHAGLTLGRIWEGYRDRVGESGIAAVADYAQRHGAPVILERKPKELLLGDYQVLRGLLP